MQEKFKSLNIEYAYILHHLPIYKIKELTGYAAYIDIKDKYLVYSNYARCWILVDDNDELEVRPYPEDKANIVTDIILVNNSKVLLIKRSNAPFKDFWALPGGFLDNNELIIDCATRELQEETGVICNTLKFIGYEDGLDRDPRSRNISFIFYGRVTKDVELKSGDDAKEVKWFDIHDLPELAFDHESIIFKHIISKCL